MKKYCVKCGKPFDAAGREVICPQCKEAAAAAAKRAAVERAKARSYSGEACPVRISARARGFIEAVAQAQGTKFIPALDKVLEAVCTKYGFESWGAVPEHKTARRATKAAKVVTTVTPVTPAAPVKTTSKAAGKPQEAPQASKPQANKPQGKQEAPQAVTKAAKAASKASKK